MHDAYETYELWIDGAYVLFLDETVEIAYEDILDAEPAYAYKQAA